MATFMRNIDVVSRGASLYRDDKLAQYGIAGCQSKYILHVCKNPGQTQDDMARTLFVNKSNVTRAVATLEKEGYIEKRQSEEDKRSYLLYPTQKALEVKPYLAKAHADFRELVTQGMTEEEKALLFTLTEKLVDNIEKFRDNRN